MAGYYKEVPQRRKVNSVSYVANSNNSFEPPLPESQNTADGYELNETYQPEASVRDTICDTLYYSNGVKMIVKVTRVYANNTYYILCDSDNEAEWRLETSRLKSIHYSSGKIDSLNALTLEPSFSPTFQQNTDGVKPYSQFKKDPVAEIGKKQAENALIWVIVGFFLCGFAMIPGFILAGIAKNKLRGKPGYEKSYKLANVLSIIGLVFLGLLLLILAIVISMI